MPYLNYQRTLVLDVELQCWNWPTPPGFKQDIIQIGVVEIDPLSGHTREASYYVRPDKLQISSFCTELTGITEETIKKQGHPFPHVLNRLIKDFGPHKKMCLTWGDDRGPIDLACQKADVKNPFTFTDLSWLYRSTYGISRNVSVSAALESFGLNFEGRAHDALIDARNTADIFIEMCRRTQAAHFFQNKPEVFKHPVKSDSPGSGYYAVELNYCTLDLGHTVPCNGPPRWSCTERKRNPDAK